MWGENLYLQDYICEVGVFHNIQKYHSMDIGDIKEGFYMDSDKKTLAKNPGKFSSNKYLYALIGICLLFFLAKMPFLAHYPMWDETVYLGMGKYIYSAGSSGLWEMIRPLGLPLLTGLWWSLGLDQMIASRIVAVIFSIGIIWMTYLICRKIFNEKTGLISAFIMAITPIFFFYSDYVMTDHVSTLAILVSIYFIMNNRYILGGSFAGLAFWFKFTHILFVGALVLYMVYKLFLKSMNNKKTTKDINNKNMKNKRDAYHKILPKEIYSIAIIIIMVGVYFLSNFLLYNDHFGFRDAILRPYTDAAAYSDNPYQNTYFSNVQEFIYYIFYYLYNIIFNTAYGNILYIFFIIYVAKLKGFMHDEKHALLFILFIVYLAYFSIIPYKNERFWIFILPLLAIYAAYGIIQINNYLRKKTRNNIILKKTLSVLFILLLVMTFYVINKDRQFYGWSEHFRKPDMSIERYFDIHNIDGPILTSDPRFAAYSDKRYIPAYDILNKNGLFLNDWESGITFNAAVYNDKSIPCLEDDKRCIDTRQKIVDMLEKDFVVLDSYKYNGANITFYKKKQ